jgi:hypothetical protein
VSPRSRAQCLSCCRLLNPSRRFDCPGCGFPLCGPACRDTDWHREECGLFLEAGWRAQVDSLEGYDSQYSAVTVIRLLLVMEREQKLDVTKKQVDKKLGEVKQVHGLTRHLMDHNVERRTEQPKVWMFEKEFIVDFIHNNLQLQERFLEDQIHRAAGILMTNATSLSLPEEGFGRVTALFPVFSMMNHSCCSNTKTLMNPDHSQEVHAQVLIRAGEEVTNQYLKVLQPTAERRSFLREKWFFDCLCRRCSSPSELGSHLGSLVCHRRRCQGVVTAARPLDYSSDYGCQQCGATVTRQEVTARLEAAARLVEDNRPGEDEVEHHERVLDALSTVLHTNHALLLEVKQRLGLLYGNVKPWLWAELGRAAKERKVQVCGEVVNCLACLEGGYSMARTGMLAELTHARVLLAREDFAGGRVTRKVLGDTVIQAKFLMMHMAYQNRILMGKQG